MTRWRARPSRARHNKNMKLKNFLRTVAAGVALAVTGHAQTVFNATNNLGSPVAVAYYATNNLGAISSFGSLTNVATNGVAVLSNTNVWTGVAIVSSGIGAARVNPFSTLVNTNGAPVNYLATNGLLQYFNLLTLSTPGGAVTNGATPTNSPSGAIPLPVQNYAGTNFPNGIYSAGYGSLYNQFDTPTGTNFISQWIKSTTTGNMGWVINAGASVGSAPYVSQVKFISGNYNAAADTNQMTGTNLLYSVNTAASNIVFTLPAAFANQFGVENHGTNIVVFTNAPGVTCVLPNGTNLNYVTTFSNLYPLKVVWFEQLNGTNIVVVNERVTDAQIKLVADNEIAASGVVTNDTQVISWLTANNISDPLGQRQGSPGYDAQGAMQIIASSGFRTNLVDWWVNWPRYGTSTPSLYGMSNTCPYAGLYTNNYSSTSQSNSLVVRVPLTAWTIAISVFNPGTTNASPSGSQPTPYRNSEMKMRGSPSMGGAYQ